MQGGIAALPIPADIYRYVAAYKKQSLNSDPHIQRRQNNSILCLTLVLRCINISLVVGEHPPHKPHQPIVTSCYDGTEETTMNETDLQIYEMYFVDGMRETEIAESMGLSLLTVHEVIAVLEEMVQDKGDAA